MKRKSLLGNVVSTVLYELKVINNNNDDDKFPKDMEEGLMQVEGAYIAEVIKVEEYVEHNTGSTDGDC
jgi:hypothetical protein